MKSAASWLWFPLLALLGTATLAVAANSPLFAAAWQIAAKGKAQSSGELLFRVTPQEGVDALEVTVAVVAGTSDLNVARQIRSAFSRELRPDPPK